MKKAISILICAFMVVYSAFPAFGAQGRMLLGDADSDDSITILDATRIQRTIAELDELNDDAKAAADVDGDGEVTVLDATRIQRYVAELCNLNGSTPYDPDRPAEYVRKEPTSLTLNASDVNLTSGETFLLTYTLSEGSFATVTYSVDNKQLVSVSAESLVYAKSEGTAVVTATTDNGLTASCTFRIRDKVTSITLPLQHINVPVNGKVTLSASVDTHDDSEKVVWKSSNTDVAAVSGNKLSATITGKAAGKATITVTAESGAKASCTVDVTKTKTSDSLKNQINSLPLYPLKTGIVALDNKVEAVFRKIFKSGYTTYDKLKAVYDYEIANFSYAYTDLTEEQYKTFSDNPNNRQLVSDSDWILAKYAYETLVTGEGVCYNYAAVFTVMMRAIGLECFSINGTSTYADGHWGVHTWNNILINGRFLLFDAQVDDNITNNLGYTLYDRFGLTDAESTTDYKYKNANRLDDINSFWYFEGLKDFSVKIRITCGGQTWTKSYSLPADQYYASIVFDLSDYDGPFDYVIEVTSGSGKYLLYGDEENYDSSHYYSIDRFEGSFDYYGYYGLMLLDVSDERELSIYFT